MYIRIMLCIYRYDSNYKQLQTPDTLHVFIEFLHIQSKSLVQMHLSTSKFILEVVRGGFINLWSLSGGSE